jgi:selenocysteine lyase/cysteine desulfurase
MRDRLNHELPLNKPVRSSRQPLDRRNALKQMMLAGAASGFAWNQLAAGPVSLPQQELLKTDPEKFWETLRREQFLLNETRAFLNPASLGVMPRPVLQAVFDSLTRAAEYATDEVPRWGYEHLDQERAEMAEFLGCRPTELAFTHNCTEALSIVANGIELQAGDEVLITNQEHGSGMACWYLKAARCGTTVRQVELPPMPNQPAELVDRMISAIGPKTRVLSFSGILSPTGLLLPVAQICAAAREKGIVTVVDGAHMNGQVPLNISELGCDYFAGSPHKWLFAPPGCGFLYGREDSLDHIWPCVVSMGWDNIAEWHAGRFMIVGTNNRSTIDGMLAGVRFFRELGPQTVFDRVHSLAKLVLKAARQRHYLEVLTPDDSRFFQAIVAARIKSDDAAKLDALWAALQAENVYVLHTKQLRLSTHIHTRPADIEKFFAICDRVLGS